ncbi:MAG: metallopeptidase TldD-related protein [Methanomassiliicoccaceae archaeon]|nr:metallopeptidase TldD-related protein [Methanomassiliicoccaceae archaeon]
MDLHDIAAASLKYAKEADHAEVYTIKSFTRCAYIDGSRISNIETKTDSGMCVRVSSDNRPGRACATLSGKDSAENCVNSALRISAFSPKSAFRGFPLPSKPSVKVNVVDRKIENVTDSELKDLLSSVIGSCRSEIPRGSLRLSVIESVVANSNGLLTEHKSTMMYGHFTSMFRSVKNGEGTESMYGVSLRMDPERTGEELDRKARASASAAPFRGKEKITMILPPCELGDMIMSSACSALNGENVHYKRSVWSEKLDKKVASGSLTIIDDPAVPGPLCPKICACS